MANKIRFPVLDFLRFIASVIVILVHAALPFANPITALFNHGYLTVDFFYLLSGFMLVHVYQDKWNKTSLKDFLIHRLIRLYPMILIGMALGLTTFCVQGCRKVDNSRTQFSDIIGALVLHLFMIPQSPSSRFSIRSLGELFPLNGPNWSLFYELLGNILYGLFLRKLTLTQLKFFVVIFGIALTILSVSNFDGFYHLDLGWSFGTYGYYAILRMLFSQLCGMVLAYTATKPHSLPHPVLSSLMLLLISFCAPYISPDGKPSIYNGIYDAFVVIIILPLVLFIATSNPLTFSSSFVSFSSYASSLSYPLFSVQFPILHYLLAWERKTHAPMNEAYLQVSLFIGSCLALAWISARYLDDAIRSILKRILSTESSSTQKARPTHKHSKSYHYKL